MPAVAEVILLLLFVQGKRNQEALEAKKKFKGSSINKQTQNSNKRCIVVATGELGALEKQRRGGRKKRRRVPNCTS
jgi:hypothetical protein